jgi:hypothetical protein
MYILQYCKATLCYHTYVALSHRPLPICRISAVRLLTLGVSQSTTTTTTITTSDAEGGTTTKTVTSTEAIVDTEAA